MSFFPSFNRGIHAPIHGINAVDKKFWFYSNSRIRKQSWTSHLLRVPCSMFYVPCFMKSRLNSANSFFRIAARIALMKS